MTEEAWHAARLIPTSGINGAEEQERRATSALLAVISAVREFGRGLIKPFGAPAGNLETYIEVPFQLGDQRVFPDGLIRVSRGQKQWTALIEVKTGSNTLEAEQLEAYLDVAKEHGFDALITISKRDFRHSRYASDRCRQAETQESRSSPLVVDSGSH